MKVAAHPRVKKSHDLTNGRKCCYGYSALENVFEMISGEPPNRRIPSFWTAGTVRRGAVLLLTLIVIVMLSISAYSFSESALGECLVGDVLARRAQRRVTIESAVETLAAHFDEAAIKGRAPSPLVETKYPPDVQLLPVSQWNNSRLLLEEADQPIKNLGSSYQSARGHVHRYLRNESAKLNLNSLPLLKHQRTLSRRRLMTLPRMTASIADAILDWMDPDDEPSEFGAESQYYSRLTPPYRPRQSRFESLDELLLVRGVTEDLLYGHSSHNPDSIPWLDLITLHGAESTRRADQVTQKIDINNNNLIELYEILHKEFGEEVARFIVGWRMVGGVLGSEGLREDSTPVSAGEVGGSTNQDRESFRSESARRRLVFQMMDDQESYKVGTKGVNENVRRREQVTRGGLNLSRLPSYNARTILDFLGTNVRIDVNNKDTVLENPWKIDPKSFENTLSMLESRLTTTSDPYIVGRIDVMTAAKEVLLSIPDLSQPQVDSIVATRRRLYKSPESMPQTVAWLFSEGVLTFDQLRDISPYVTVSGTVWSGVVTAGDRSHSQPSETVFFRLDTGLYPARIAHWQILPADRK